MRKYILWVCSWCWLSVALAQSKTDRYTLIPQPLRLVPMEGTFTFSRDTKLVVAKNNPALLTAVAPLTDRLETAAGITLVVRAHQKSGQHEVVVSLDPAMTAEEGYMLVVTPATVNIRAKTPTGVFYAIQTLLQLLPPAIESPTAISGTDWSAPCVSIVDAPRFAYRGVMLDVARHYMPLAFLHTLVDLLALQKMNRLHLHLTDSQGWRFESLRYPKLTGIGAFRKGDPMHTTYDYASRPADSLYGGYYTQDQLRELVAYASARQVTIIPEIEMPAHSMSALASYPWLACLDSLGQPYAYPQDVQNEYCTKDSVFDFLDNVLQEVMDVFPSKYIHIGGDEAGKADWKVCPYDLKRIQEQGLKNVEELQSYFIRRVERYVNSRGRQIIGWDEILEGGLAPNAAVMSWQGEEGGIAAARQHHSVVMTPGDYCYLDHYQSDAPGEPVAFCCMTTLQKAYSYDPVPSVLSVEESHYIEGVQGNLWTEYVPTPSKAEYMIFPRATALAEVGWSSAAAKDFPDFTRRLNVYLKRLDEHQVNYSRHVFELKAATSRTPDGAIVVGLTGSFGHPVYYTLDGSVPTGTSAQYKGPIDIRQNALLTAAVIENGMILDRISKAFILHKAVGKKVVLSIPPDPAYNRGGDSAWVNGVPGSDEQYDDDEWLGWNGVDFNGTIDFGRPETLHSLRMRFFNKPASVIWLPQKVTVQTSDDGVHFYSVGETVVGPAGDSLTKTVVIDLHSGTARYLKITAVCTDVVPAGYPGEGGKAWLFVDEAIVE